MKTKPKVLLHHLLCLFCALPAFRQVDHKFPRIRKLNEILFRFLLAVVMNRIIMTYPYKTKINVDVNKHR